MKRTDIPSFGPLSGLRVVASGINVAGPFAAALMADMGADVIFHDSPKVPDMMRTTDTLSLVNKERRNARSLALDVVSEEGREAFMKLLSETDIFIENSKAGAWDRRGMSDEELWKINPKLVIAHVSGYGQYGDPAYLQRGSFDSIGQALSGYLTINGTPDEPCAAPAYMGDYTTALITAFGCLAALRNAEKTGKGESLDIAQYEALLAIQGGYDSDWFNYGKQRTRGGKDHPSFSGWGQFQCKDGAIYIQILSKAAIAKAFTLFGIDEHKDMYENLTFFIPRHTPVGDLVDEAIAKWCADKTVMEADQIINAAGLTASGLITYDMMLSHPHYIARETIMEYPSITGEMVKGNCIVPRMKNNPGKVWRGAPHYGEDNADILEELGYSAEDVQRFYDNKLLNKSDKY